MKNNLLLVVLLLISAHIYSQITTVGKYKIDGLESNSKKSDFGTTFYGENKIIFSSSRNDAFKTKWKGNNQAFLDLYEGDIQEDGSVSNIKKFSSRLNSKYHESSVSFTPDQKTVYFTRNNYYKNKLEKDEEGTTNLAIYKATVSSGGVWKDIVSLPFNHKDYSTGHPTVSRDGKKLYFTSNMPGTRGMTDIFVVDIKPNNEYSTPKNLGRKINTSGKEMFPYIDKNNVLYFSSDSQKEGIGGLDIYASKIFTKSVSKAYHLGEPINSELDDFSYILNNEKNEGYFSSNREDGVGDDDIYHFKASPPLHIECEQEITGVVKDKNTGVPIFESSVVLLDEDGKELSTTLTKGGGEFSFTAACGVKYMIKASKDSYEMDSKEFATEDEPSAKTDLELNLATNKGVVAKPNFEEIKVIKDKVIVNIDPIYFSLDKADIRNDASRELDKVVKIMKKYPELKIEGGSHTDVRGSASYNEKLSAKRANSTVAYIIKQGVDSSRISARGYGELQPANHCLEGVRCSDAEHQQNRRTEFVILNPEVLGYMD